MNDYKQRYNFNYSTRGRSHSAEKLQWKDLKSNKCPRCGTDFDEISFADARFINCPRNDFKISHDKFKLIVSKKVTAELEAKWKEEDEKNFN